MPPQPKPRRGKKIGIIAIIAVTVAILLVGAYLAVALLKPSPQTGTATPTVNTTTTAQAAAAAQATAAAATATAAPATTPTTAPASSPTAQGTAPVAQSGLPCTVNIPTWTDGSSDWKVLNSMLLNDGTNGNGPYNNGPSIVAPCQLGSTTNYAVQTQIQVTNASNGGCFGISVRGNPLSSGWQGYLAGVGDCGSNVSAAYIGGPNYNNDNQSVQASFDPGKSVHTYRIEVSGNTIKFFVDGSLLLNLTDNRYLTGAQVGLWCENIQLQVTSFQVTALS